MTKEVVTISKQMVSELDDEEKGICNVYTPYSLGSR